MASDSARSRGQWHLVNDIEKPAVTLIQTHRGPQRARAMLRKRRREAVHFHILSLIITLEVTKGRNWHRKRHVHQRNSIEGQTQTDAHSQLLSDVRENRPSRKGLGK